MNDPQRAGNPLWIAYETLAMLLGLSALALLCLGWPQLLMEKGMGQVLSAFFALFWLSRVIVQLTYYDRALRAQNRCWDVFFLAVFFTLAIIFALATFFP